MQSAEASGRAVVVADRFRLDRPISRGGMAEVYAATELSTGRTLALKWLRPEVVRDARVTAMFKLEFHTLRGLDHPNIIRVHEFGSDGGRAFYTMELLDGVDLGKLAPVPYKEACKYLRDVATSLSLLHTRRVLHRDVGPRNVRITSAGHCKLLDFGAMAHFGPAPLVGTPPLVAPECLRGAPLDHRTDLFALGGLAHYLLTGKHAYYARTFDDLPELWRAPLAPPSSLAPDVPPALDALVLSLLRLDPSTRPWSAAFVIERLTILGDLPPTEQIESGESFLDSAPLSGRARKLAELSETVKKASYGDGASMLLEGNPGVGKTRMLEELGAEAQLAGAIVAETAAHAEAGPLSAMRALCATLLRVAPIATREALAAHGGVLGHILPELEWPDDRREVLPNDTLARRAVLQRALVASLSSLSKRHALVLSVDDVERADDPSLGVLTALARETRGHTKLLIVASVSRASKQAARPALAALLRELTCVRVHRLARAGTTELVHHVFGDVPNADRFATYLHDATTGHPAQLMQLLRYLVQSKLVSYVGGTWSLPGTMPNIGMPESVVDDLRARLSRLPKDARTLVQLMALYEGPVPIDVLTRAAGFDEAGAFDALQVAFAAGVCIASEGSHRLSQDAFRQAVQAELPRDRARALHLGLARALEARVDPSVDERVQAGHHLLAAGLEVEGAKKLDAATAGRAYAGLDLIAAARAVAAALDVYERHGAPLEKRLRLQVKLVIWSPFTEATNADRYGQSALPELFEGSGLATAQRMMKKLPGPLALALGFAWAILRRPWLSRSRRGLSFVRSLLGFFSVLMSMIAVRAIRLDSEGVSRLAPYVEPLRVFAKKSTPYAIYLYSKGQLLQFQGDLLGARALLDRYLALFDQPGTLREARPDERVEMRFSGLVTLSQVCMRHGDPVVLDVIARMTDDSGALATATREQLRAMFHMVRGEWAAAQEALREFERVSANVSDVWQLEEIMVPFAGFVASNMRDLVALKRTNERLRTLVDHAPSLERTFQIMQLAYQALGGRPETAVLELEALVQAMVPHSHLLWYDARAVLSATYLLLGRHREALALTEEVLEATEGRVSRLDLTIVQMRWVRAEALIALSRPEEALEALDALLRDAAPTGAPVLHVHTHGLRALVRKQLGDTRGQSEDLDAMRRHAAASGHPLLLESAAALAARASVSIPGDVAVEVVAVSRLEVPAGSESPVTQIAGRRRR